VVAAAPVGAAVAVVQEPAVVQELAAAPVAVVQGLAAARGAVVQRFTG
jgi:hypothetical protein